MRQGQQNRRGRGRNNNGGGGHNNNHNSPRKGQNPMTRSFESNGPEVKIRGNPAHVAEKYMSLARDALSSGDPVLAENYLQHAEHYNRIIMAYREQQASEMGQNPQNGTPFTAQPARLEQSGDFEGSGDEGDEFSGEGQAQVTTRGTEQQPRSFEGSGQPRFDDRPQRHQDHQPRHQNRDRPHYENRGGYQDRDRGQDRGPDRNQDRNQDRGDRRPYQSDRQERFDRGDRPERADRPNPERGQERLDRPTPVAEPRSESNPPRRRDRPQGPERLPAEAHEQPEFLRRPVRRPRRDDDAEAAPVVPAVDDSTKD